MFYQEESISFLWCNLHSAEDSDEAVKRKTDKETHQWSEQNRPRNIYQGQDLQHLQNPQILNLGLRSATARHSSYEMGLLYRQPDPQNPPAYAKGLDFLQLGRQIQRSEARPLHLHHHARHFRRSRKDFFHGVCVQAHAREGCQG